MIEIRRKRIVIDGEAQILMSGEVHYFRLARDEWADRVDKLVAAGCDTVASYIPWLCHELDDGTYDLDGRTRDELDLGAFIDLCRDRGLRFLARPGPFVMAELKNEGLPFRIYREHPHIHPVSWDGAPAPTRTVDYLSPDYLAEVRRWYAAVMPVLAPRLATRGGNIIAVQIDNEVGMLSWVANAPDLTDHVLDDFARWLRERHGDALTGRYSFPLDDPAQRAKAVRSPAERDAPALMRDIGHYMRDRFARYLATLRDYAEDEDIRGVPFVVNVHGSKDGRGTMFPIGISQLADSYRGVPGMVSGSDHYLGDLNSITAVDLYLINAFMDAANDADQPLTSVEFEAGDQDYARQGTPPHDPSSVGLKTRLSVAQGNRLINYYLFTGGTNPRLSTPVGDGNDRIGFTGQRHGTGAPVGPEGRLNRSYAPTAEVVHAVRAIAPRLATMTEEHDGLALAFVPDYFMTESVYPGSASMREITDNLERNRGGGPGQAMAQALLYAGYRFGAVDVQHSPPSPADTPVLALASARYMDGGLQRDLVGYLRGGGRLLLCGEVPDRDLEGRPCTDLQTALGLTPRGSRHADLRFFLSVCAAGWAAPRPEVCVGYAQLFDPAAGDLLLYDYDSGAGCGFDLRVGDGRAIVLTTDYPAGDLDFYRRAVETLGARAGLRHDAEHGGVLLTSTANDEGERLVHVLNLDGYEARFGVFSRGRPLFGGHRFAMSGRSGLILPIDLRMDGGRLAYATAEIAALAADSVTFRLGRSDEVFAFATDRPVSADIPAHIRTEDGLRVVRPTAGGADGELCTLRLG